MKNQGIAWVGRVASQVMPKALGSSSGRQNSVRLIGGLGT